MNSVLLWTATSHNWDAHPSICLAMAIWPWSPRTMGSNQHHKLHWRLMDVGLNASCRSLPNLLGLDATCGHPKNNEVHKCMHRRAMTWYSTLGPVSILHRYQSFIVFHGLDTLSVIKQSQKLAVVGWRFLLLWQGLKWTNCQTVALDHEPLPSSYSSLCNLDTQLVHFIQPTPPSSFHLTHAIPTLPKSLHLT